MAGRHGLKLVVGQFSPENTAGSPAGTMKNILRVIHTVHLEHSPQAALIERTVVGHQRQPFYQRSHLLPHIGEYRRIGSILQGKAVHPGIPVTVILRLGLYEAVEAVYYLSTPHNHYSHTAHTGTLLIGYLKIYGCKIFHGLKYKDKDRCVGSRRYSVDQDCLTTRPPGTPDAPPPHPATGPARARRLSL